MNTIRKIIKHYRVWNYWRKLNSNSKFHKFLVLIGFIHSPTFGLASASLNIQETIKAFNDFAEVAKSTSSAMRR